MLIVVPIARILCEGKESGVSVGAGRRQILMASFRQEILTMTGCARFHL